MSNNFCEKSTSKYLRELRSIDSDSARKYILDHGYSSSSFEVPEYYKAEGLSNIKLKPIDWNTRGKKVLITKPLNFLTPKGQLSWRSFNLIHPYIFVHIVNEITKEENWKEIKKILCKKTEVYSYSTPVLNKEGDCKVKAGSISRWLQMAENDIVKDSVNFSFLTVTDIKNFYPSIYTHSIAWAINGREVIKSDRFNYGLLGNKLDKLFQNSMDGQTNGIPVGSMVSDIVAEIILKRVDASLSKWVKGKKIDKEIIMTRYRDDYRILSRNSEQGKMVLKALSRILNQEYNLAINSEKTKVYNDVLEGSFRDWSNEINGDYLLRLVKYEDLPLNITASLLKDILLKTHRLQKKYPDGRASITLLNKLSSHLNNEDVELEIDKIDVHTTVSILRRLSLLREESSAQVYLLLDALFENLDESLQDSIIDELCELVKNDSDNDYQTIWLYRLCLSRRPSRCSEIIKSSESSLTEILKDNYCNGTLKHYEIFDDVDDLTPADKKQLNKFTYVDSEKLGESENSVIDIDLYELFRY